VKVDRDSLQINVVRNQSTYLQLFTSGSSAPSLISDAKSGALINSKAESISSSQSANLKMPGSNISLSREVLDELKSRVRIKASASEISVTPVRGFTGILVVPVAATIDGVETVVLNKVIVNPAPPVAQKFAPTAINKSAIAWAPSASQVLSYEVAVNGKTICQTTATSCPVDALIGPNSKVTLTAQGNDKTVSTAVVVPYVATKPIPALKVNFAVGSSILSSVQKIEIRVVSRVIDAEGFTKLVVSGFTDSSGSKDLNQKLSAARAKAVAAYMRTLLPTISIKASAFGKSRPVSSNASKSGQAQNRRTEIATW
jgi:outer membrane protein OmpA-like peptidoglycan-associated protein